MLQNLLRYVYNAGFPVPDREKVAKRSQVHKQISLRIKMGNAWVSFRFVPFLAA